MSTKPRVVKDYEKLDPGVLEQIKLAYPMGFRKHLITFRNAQGDMVSALPFETDDRYYLVRMTIVQAVKFIEDDDDYDEDGNLKPKVRKAYTAKHDGSGDDEDFGLGLGDGDDDLGFDDDDDLGGGEDDEDPIAGGTVDIDDVDVVDPSTL